MNRALLLVALLSVGACRRPEPASAAPPSVCPRDRALSIASWNLEWLNRRPGRGKVKRQAADYARLAKYAQRLNVDVVAFQEVDGPKAAARVFDPAQWQIHTTRQKNPQRTGFAIRRGIAFTANRDFDDIDVGGVRTGADITVHACGKDVRLLSLHLKSMCFQDELTRENNACRKLRAQLPILEGWIDARANESVPFVVIGDLNRRFLPGDTFWPEINDANPPNAALTDAGHGHASACWNGKYPDYIDHIVLDKRATQWLKPGSFRQLLYDESDAPYASTLSDHCPIAVTLQLR